MEIEPKVLAEPDASDADSLISTNVPDDLENEQTWPTEEELNGHRPDDYTESAVPDAEKGTTPRRVKRVPKGWSEYQAAWIVDEDDGEEAEEGDDSEVDADAEEGEDIGMEEDNKSARIEMDEEEEMEDLEMSSRKNVAFEDLDMEEESRQYACYSVLFTRLLTIPKTSRMAFPES